MRSLMVVGRCCGERSHAGQQQMDQERHDKEQLHPEAQQQREEQQRQPRKT